MKTAYMRRECGFATLIALIMVGMLTLIGLAALSTSDDEVTIAGNQLQEMRAFYAAEAGLEKAASQIFFAFDSAGTPPETMPSSSETMNRCAVTFSTIDNGPAQQKALTSGTLSGLNALVKTFSLTSTAVSNVDNSKVTISVDLESALVPIFQFAVFYGNDLEIAPGPDMTLMGRVHSNGNLYLQAGSNLKMDSYVTASGDIYHGPKAVGKTESTGDVLIKNASGTYVSMKDGSDWLDSEDSCWYDSSIARWNGRVQDAAHGQEALNVPVNGSSDDPHKLIERGQGNPDSYEHEATLKFIDGQAYQLVGETWNNVTADMTSKGIISVNNNAFYDGREKKWVDVIELDIDELYDDGYAPSNGILYFADATATKDFPALRINNAEELEDKLTVASENPVYTNGHFNSTNKKAAAIMADAVTFLSRVWDDANSDKSINNRVAKETKVNASIMTGNTETVGSSYNGGFENLPRFLEKWSKKKFTWTGSMVNLWYSQQANGEWSCGSVYKPPKRDWSYDPDLDNPANHPPGAPDVRVFQRTGWKQQHVGYNDEG